MKLFLMTFIATALLLPAQPRKTVYVDRMEGLEPFVERALQDAELPFDFVEEQNKPELKASLVKTQGAYGEILYQHKLGRYETHALEFRDLARNRVIARYTFRLAPGDESRQRAALEFAKQVKRAVAKESETKQRD